MHQYISPQSRATQKRPVSKSISTCENTPDSAWLSGVGVEGLRVKALQFLARHHAPTQQAARLQTMANRYAMQQRSIWEKPEDIDNPSGRNPTGLFRNVKAGIEHGSGHHPAPDADLNTPGPKNPGVEAMAKSNHIDAASSREEHIPRLAQPIKAKAKPTQQMKAFDKDDAPLSPPIRSHQASVIQCKVYMGVGNQIKEKTLFDDLPIYDKKWLDDDVERHFESLQELMAFQNHETDHIGWLTAEKLWIRLHPGNLCVIGEDHLKTKVRDIVSAVRTKRFMDEAYGDIPDFQKPHFKGLMKHDLAFRKDIESKMNLPLEDDFDHHLEDLFRQIHAGLIAVLSKCTLEDELTLEDADEIERIHRDKTLEMDEELEERYDLGMMLADIFGQGLKIANDVSMMDRQHPATAALPEKELAKMWRQRRGEWTEILRKIDNHYCIQILIRDAPQAMQSMTRLLLDYLLYNYEVQFFPLHRMQLPDLKLLGKSLSLKNKIENEDDFIKVDENFKEMNKAIDRFRELYMLERIKYAQAKNYILVGMGEIHLKNLTPQLAQLGLRPELMDSFLARQRREQEVRKRQSQRRRPIHTS